MLVAVVGVKGGVGTTSIAALLALANSERAEPSLLVDLTGDGAAALGVDAEPSAPVLAAWIDGDRRTTELDVAVDLSMLPADAASAPPGLADALRTDPRLVVADCATVGAGPPFLEILDRADAVLLVVRNCYLALRAAKHCAIEPDGVVFVREPHRALKLCDVEAVIDAPVVLEIAHDPSVARLIDAGLTAGRLPRRLIRSLAEVID